MKISKIASIALAGSVVLTLAGCGSSGSSSSSNTNPVETNATTAQNKVSTVEGTLPSDVTLADGADLRSISGVKDVGAICTDGTILDGYFKKGTNGENNFIVDIPSDKDCSIVLLDRKQTEGNSLAKDTTILAATPSIKPESSKVTVNMTAINNGVATVEVKNAQETNAVSAEEIVNKPLSVAAQEVKQRTVAESNTNQTTESNATQTTESNATQTTESNATQTTESNATQTTANVGKAVGNVDTGWLDKRVVGYGIDNIKRSVLGSKSNYSNTKMKGTVTVGNYLYLLQNTGGSGGIVAIDTTTGKKVDCSVVGSDGSAKTQGSDFDINQTLINGDMAWINSDKTLKLLKFGTTKDSSGKLQVTLLNSNKTLSSNSLNTTKIELNDNYLIDKTGIFSSGQRWIFWYDKASNAIKSSYIQGTFFFNSYLGNLDYILYSPNGNSILNNGVNQNKKFAYASFDESNNKFTVKSSSNDVNTTLGHNLNVNDVNAIQYIGKYNNLHVFEVVDANSTHTQRLDLISFNPNDGSTNKATVTSDSGDSNTSVKFNTIASSNNVPFQITKNGWVLGAVDVNTSADFNKSLYIAHLKSNGLLVSDSNMTASFTNKKKGSNPVNGIKKIVDFTDTLRLILTNNGVGYVAGVGAGKLQIDNNVSQDDVNLSTTNQADDIYLGMADKANNLIYADDNATTNNLVRLHFNTATWTWEDNANGGAKSSSSANIPAHIINAKILDKDNLFVETSDGNISKIQYDKINNNLASVKYNNNNMNIKKIVGFNPKNWFKLYENNSTLSSSGIEHFFSLRTDNDIPYYNDLAVLGMPNNDTNITLSNDGNYVLVDTNSGLTDLIKLNTASKKGATKVAQFLKNKNIQSVYTIGNNIYAVDGTNNLYVIPHDENISATIKPVGNFIGVINSLVANNKGDRIYVAVGVNNFIKVINGNGNQIQSLQVFVKLPNGVDSQTALKNLKLAYAGDYVYVLGTVYKGNVIVPGANTTTTKDFGYLKVYKIQEDGTLKDVKDIKLFEYSDSSSPLLNAYFAKVVGNGSNAKLYISYKNNQSGSVAEQYNLSNPSNPQKEGSVQLVTTLGGPQVNTNYVFSSQYIAAYAGRKVQLYKLPGLAAQPAITLPNEYIGSASKVFAFGNYLFVETLKRIAIIDLSDPQHPRLAGDVDLTLMGNKVSVNNISVKVFGDKTYLVVGQAGTTSLPEGGVTEIDLNSLQLKNQE